MAHNWILVFLNQTGHKKLISANYFILVNLKIYILARFGQFSINQSNTKKLSAFQKDLQ